MITKIGIISGEILELLEKKKILVFGELHWELKESRDLVIMSLGWLLNKGYIQILEDPTRAVYKNAGGHGVYTTEAAMFDLIIENNPLRTSVERIKNMAGRISSVVEKILVLLEGYGDLLDLRTLESNLYEHRDIVLMGLGWLIREGYVRGVAGANETFIFRLPKERGALELEDFCHV